MSVATYRLGGSEQGLLQYRVTGGEGQRNVIGGTNTLRDAARQTRGNYAQANRIAQRGGNVMDAGLASQNRTLAGLLNTASRRGPSQALAQQQQGLRQLQQANLSAARSMGGGNTALGLRQALASNQQTGLGLLGQQGMLRAAEEDAYQQRLLGAQQAAAQQFGGQANLGAGVQGTGLAAALNSTGQLAGIGGQQAQIGLEQQGLGLRADISQLDADMKRDELELQEDRDFYAALGTYMGGFGSGLAGAFG